MLCISDAEYKGVRACINWTAHRTPNSAPIFTMKFAVFGASLLAALLASNIAYAAQVACTSNIDCLLVTCPSGGRPCSPSFCLGGICSAPNCPRAGQQCPVSGVFLPLWKFGCYRLTRNVVVIMNVNDNKETDILNRYS